MILHQTSVFAAQLREGGKEGEGGREEMLFYMNTAHVWMQIVWKCINCDRV